MTEEIKPVKIKGTVYWASLKKVNQMSGNYQVDIGELSEAAVKALEAMGVTALHKDTQGFYIPAKAAMRFLQSIRWRPYHRGYWQRL